MTRDEVTLVIKEVLAEEHEKQSQAATQDAAVLNVVSAILTSFGINEDDRKDIRADFIYLRSLRQTSQHIQRGGWIALMAVFVSGIAGVVFLGFKAFLSKP